MTSQLKTIKVQGGKEYAEVHTRVNYFRSSEKYKDWGCLLYTSDAADE